MKLSDFCAIGGLIHIAPTLPVPVAVVMGGLYLAVAAWAYVKENK